MKVFSLLNRSLIAFIFVLICIGNEAKGQTIKVINSRSDFKDETKFNGIDVKIINNTILLPVTLSNGFQVYFILDTGVSTPIITDPIITPFLNLELIRSFEVTGYGADEPLLAHVAEDLEYTVGPEHHFKEPVIVLDQAIDLQGIIGEPVYGLIGASIFKNNHVVIDFARSKIHLKSSENPPRYPKRYKKLELDVIAEKPFINTEVSTQAGTDSLLMLIDTGFTGSINLYPHKGELLDSAQQTIENYIGIGLNGVVQSTLFRSEHINLASTKVKEPLIHLMDEESLVNTTISNYSDGSLGNEILRRFRIAIDYTNEAIWLKPRRSRLREDFHYNASGIRLVQVYDEEIDQDVIFIATIREGSTAEESGLLPLDKVVTIAGKKADKMSLKKAYQLLNDFGDPKRRITINREDEILSFTFTINTNI